MCYTILTSILSGSLGLFTGWFLCKRFGSKGAKFLDGDMKLVLVVRKDLKMGNGKIAAQCSHATLGCYKKVLKCNPELLDSWKYQGQPKVVLKVDTYDEMLELSEMADSLGLINVIIHDAGHTQVTPGSATVLGIGPAPISIIDEVTGHLKLL